MAWDVVKTSSVGQPVSGMLHHRCLRRVAVGILAVAGVMAAVLAPGAETAAANASPGASARSVAPAEVSLLVVDQATRPAQSGQRQSGGDDESSATLAIQAAASIQPAPRSRSTRAERDGAVVLSPADRRTLIDAATDEAVDRLLSQIESQAITPTLSVKELLDALDRSARSELRGFLRGSQQVGGPRFYNARVAEVQLQVEGQAVARMLTQLAALAGSDSPIDPTELAWRLEGWSRRSFRATGGSISPDVAEFVRPRPADVAAFGWANVAEDATRSAIGTARSNAVEKIITAARPVVVLTVTPRPDAPTPESTGSEEAEMPSDGTASTDQSYRLADLLDDTSDVGLETRDWLYNRPLTRLSFLEDQLVEVKLAIEPADLVDFLRVSLEQFEAGVPAITDEQWSQVEVQLGRVLPDPTGSAIAVEAGTDVAAEPAFALPQAPPQWTREPIMARGSSPASRDRLRARLVAEQAARQELRSRLLSLPLTQETTLADAVEASERVDQLLDSVVEQAVPSQTEYPSDGSAIVHFSLDSQSLWQALASR